MNRQGNPNIAQEARKWRERTSNWQDVLAYCSKTRSTGPKTDIGKLRSSLNSHKYPLGHMKSRISVNSMMGQMLVQYEEMLELRKLNK